VLKDTRRKLPEIPMIRTVSFVSPITNNLLFTTVSERSAAIR
jgi:hypothetical protein